MQVDHHPEHVPRQTHNTKETFIPTLTLLTTRQTTQESSARVHALLSCQPSPSFSPPVLSDILMAFSELTAALSVTGRLRRGKITPNVRAFVELGESSGICLLCRSKTAKFLNTDSSARTHVKMWALRGMLLLI